MLLLFGIQVGHPGGESAGAAIAPALFIIGGALVGGGLLFLARLLVPRSRTRWRGWRARRARVRAAAVAETRARALMSELCPNGWRAHVTLLEASDESARRPVALDWYELRPGGGEPIVARRVWADSIGEALEAMVADRRMDETLEQIELRASAEGVLWDDLEAS